MINKTTWNKIRYTVHSFYYDLIIAALNGERQKALQLLNAKAGSSILIVGAGTGSDLPHLKGKDYKITATDITPAMLKQAEWRAKRVGIDAKCIVMDGQALNFEENSFDYVILNLILAVIPDPYRCIKEAERVLKPGGKIVVFDKFMRDNQKPSMLRKFANVFTSTLFSDVTRRFADILAVTDLNILESKDSLLGGFFKIYILTKKGA